MWQDMTTYLAWRGGAEGYIVPPVMVPNEYAVIRYSNMEMKICTKYPDEIEWHRNHGAEIANS